MEDASHSHLIIALEGIIFPPALSVKKKYRSMCMNPPRNEAELVEIYGRENVRVHQNRLQVQEEHFHQPGGRVLEWVEADMALPPADSFDPPLIQEQVELEDPVPDMTAEDYEEAKEDAEEEDEEAE